MRSLIKNLIRLFTTPLGLGRHRASLDRQVIGLARYDTAVYFFVRENREIFLVGDTDKGCYRSKVHFSSLVQGYALNMTDLDARDLPDGTYGLVATIRVGQRYKTVYFTSTDGICFSASSMVANPNNHPTKIVILQSGDITLVTSIGGEICYRKLDLNQRDVEYHETPLKPRHDSFDHSPLRVVAAFDIPDGIFVLYDVSYDMRGCRTHRFGAALLAHDNLSHLHWRAFFDEVPFFDQFASKKLGEPCLATIGAYLDKDLIQTYLYHEESGDIYRLTLHEPYQRRDPHPDHAQLTKYVGNPILSPNPDHGWESKNTFNPAALQIDDTTHLLYRAEGDTGLSVIGYGSSHNGTRFDRLPDPVYVPRMDFEGVNVDPRLIAMLRKVTPRSGYRNYPPGIGYDWHGVEDPRVTLLDGRVYMTYSAFDGWHYARPAITSISEDDFLAQRWNWTTPQVMTEQVYQWSFGNKSVVLHPEKVGGKYMIYHRIWPHIRIDYVDDLEFGPGKKYLKELARIEARGDSWDSHKVGVAAPPILIDEGWLLIYQASGSQDRRYKVGAMILDRNDPNRVLYRSSYPIMVPNQTYEGGIAYVCGAVVRDSTLYVYYGGNDHVVCLATASLREFVDRLKRDPYEPPVPIKTKNINDLCT